MENVGNFVTGAMGNPQSGWSGSNPGAAALNPQIPPSYGIGYQGVTRWEYQIQQQEQHY